MQFGRQIGVSVFLFFAAFSGWVLADSVKIGDLEVTAAWARASAGSGKSGAAYVTVVNHGGADRLIGVSTARARKATLHTNILDNGVMRMRPADGFDVPMHGSLELAPGGDHIMLMGMESSMQESDRFAMSLIFEKAGSVEVEIEVAGVAAETGSTGHDHSDHSGMKKSDRKEAIAQIHLISPDGIGEMIGRIRIMAMESGVMIVPDLSGLSSGKHAFHIHQNPDCGPGEKLGEMVAGLKAGGHYGATHDHGAGHKPQGDLAELEVAPDGTATTAIMADKLTVDELIGRSMMIHHHGENPSDPSLAKGGGARIACGVIE